MKSVKLFIELLMLDREGQTSALHPDLSCHFSSVGQSTAFFLREMG